MVRKDDASDRAVGRQRDFKGITLHLAGNRAGDREARLGIVKARRQDQRRPPAALFMPSLRVEREPDEIAGIGHVGPGYHSSRPTGVVPQSVSLCRLCAVIFETRVSIE
jgi:hypothetical protein